MGPKSLPLRFNLSIPNSEDYAAQRLKKDLGTLGIQLKGKIVETHDAVTLPAIATHHSKSLPQLISMMLKNSDNLIANALFKAVGQHYYGGPATWTKGINAEKAILKKYVGLNPKELYIFDGSGLSFYNFVTPKQIVTLLEYAYHNSTLNKMMMQSLPISSVDGSLRHRIPSLKGLVHAKTGTRRDSSALSGYIVKNGRVAVFSVLVNDNFKVNNSTALEDYEVQKAAAAM
jgi:D-alanyl-D-alanine carboxypeptidase/D-alanyl-D-alanine-endopeptidase (penicillin-binding protein 4)